jgi:SAM-dependent methyltransferase
MDAEFAQLYAAYAELDEEDLGLWLRLARQQGDPILELGCGSGRILAHLGRAGFQPLGLDKNKTLLRLARDRLRQAGLRPLLLQGDMRRFHLRLSFSLIFIACNTLANLDDAGASQTLQRIRQHLEPLGMAAFDLPNEPLAEALEPWQDTEPLMAFRHPKSGNPVQVYARQFPAHAPGAVSVRWAFDELLPDGRVRRNEHALIYYLRAPAVYRQLLWQAGFGPVEIYGDYQLNPHTPASPRTIILARP